MNQGNSYYLVTLLGGKNQFRQTYLGDNEPDANFPKYIIKKIIPDPAVNRSFEDNKILFAQEAELLYKLSKHPQIVDQVDEFDKDGAFYLVQKRIEGESLTRELENKKDWTEAEAIALIKELLEILQYFHEISGAHLDISPESFIRRNSDRKLILIDFGAARNAELSPLIRGNPGYMPPNPEKEVPNFHWDIYAVGRIGIQALTGSHLSGDRPRINSRLARILDRMVAPYFRNRYQSVDEVLKDLTTQTYLSYWDKLFPLSPFSQKRPAVSATSPQPPDRIQVRKNRKWVILPLLTVILFLTAIGTSQIYKIAMSLSSFNQGEQQLRANKWESAIESYTTALTFKPDFYEALNQRGYALGQVSKHDKKLEDCLMALRIQQKNPNRHQSIEWFKSLNCISTAYDAQGNYRDARLIYENNLDNIQELDRNLFEIYHLTLVNYGSLLLRSTNLEDLEKALLQAEKAVDIAPNALTFTLKGESLFKLNRFEEARDAFDNALADNPNYTKAREGRERTLERINSNS